MIWGFIKKNPLILIFIGIVLFADFLAGSIPFLVKDSTGWYSPLMQSYWLKISHNDYLDKNWKAISFEKSIYPIIPFGPNEMNTDFDIQGRPNFTHYLGTDHLGRDTLSALLHGIRISLFIGILSVLVSSILAFLLGSFGIFIGDKKLKYNILSNVIFIFNLIVFIYVLCMFLEFGFQTNTIKYAAIYVIIMLAGFLLQFLNGKYKWITKSWSIPWSFFSILLTDLFIALPALFILIPISGVIKPGIFSTALTIGVLTWPFKAKILRSETLVCLSKPFIQNLELAGVSNIKIFLYHVLPNIIQVYLPILPFSISSSIILESTLSFLGIGVGTEYTTLGGLIQHIRYNVSDWWVYIPATAMLIIISIYFFQLSQKYKEYK